MNTSTARLAKLTALLVGGVMVAAVVTARAEYSAKVQKTFRGQILITEDPLKLEVLGNYAQTIKECRKRALTGVKHDQVDGVPVWSFYYTAFMKSKPRVNSLSFDFYTNDKEALYVANKRLTGIDRSVATLQGRLVISEDDGLLPNRSYVVKLVGQVKGREVVYAKTTVATK